MSRITLVTFRFSFFRVVDLLLLLCLFCVIFVLVHPITIWDIFMKFYRNVHKVVFDWLIFVLHVI